VKKQQHKNRKRSNKYIRIGILSPYMIYIGFNNETDPKDDTKIFHQFTYGYRRIFQNRISANEVYVGILVGSRC